MILLQESFAAAGAMVESPKQLFEPAQPRDDEDVVDVAVEAKLEWPEEEGPIASEAQDCSQELFDEMWKVFVVMLRQAWVWKVVKWTAEGMSSIAGMFSKEDTAAQRKPSDEVMLAMWLKDATGSGAQRLVWEFAPRFQPRGFPIFNLVVLEAWLAVHLRETVWQRVWAAWLQECNRNFAFAMMQGRFQGVDMDKQTKMWLDIAVLADEKEQVCEDMDFIFRLGWCAFVSFGKIAAFF